MKIVAILQTPRTGGIYFVSQHLIKCVVLRHSQVNKPRQEDVECLCKMLRTSGKNLEEKGERSRMDVYFKRIQALALNKSLDSRVRFALQVSCSASRD